MHTGRPLSAHGRYRRKAPRGQYRRHSCATAGPGRPAIKERADPGAAARGVSIARYLEILIEGDEMADSYVEPGQAVTRLCRDQAAHTSRVTGPADLLRSELQATAAVVFAHACPVGWNQPGGIQVLSAVARPAARRRQRLKTVPLPSRLARHPARHARRQPNGQSQSRHYRRRSHRACRAGAANALPKPLMVDQLAAGRTELVNLAARATTNQPAAYSPRIGVMR